MNGAVLAQLTCFPPSKRALSFDYTGMESKAMPGFGSFFSNISGEEAARTPLESIPAHR